MRPAESAVRMKFVLVFLVVGYSAWRTYRRWESKIPPEVKTQLREELGLARTAAARARKQRRVVRWHQDLRTRIALFLGLIVVLILWTKLYRG